VSDDARDLTTAVGAISGTSMDGIDVALIRSDGEARLQTGPGATYPYPAEIAAELRAVVADPARDGTARRARGRRHRRACRGGRALSRRIRRRSA